MAGNHRENNLIWESFFSRTVQLKLKILLIFSEKVCMKDLENIKILWVFTGGYGYYHHNMLIQFIFQNKIFTILVGFTTQKPFVQMFYGRRELCLGSFLKKLPELNIRTLKCFL
jgi:hypothetical protein